MVRLPFFTRRDQRRVRWFRSVRRRHHRYDDPRAPGRRRCAGPVAARHPRPGAVDRLAVLDIVPTGDAFRRADMDFSLGFWVWSFLAADEPVPEQLIARAPDVLVDHILDAWSDDGDVFPTEIRAEYIANFSAPERIHAICEEYRAA